MTLCYTWNEHQFDNSSKYNLWSGTHTGHGYYFYWTEALPQQIQTLNSSIFILAPSAFPLEQHALLGLVQMELIFSTAALLVLCLYR